MPIGGIVTSRNGRASGPRSGQRASAAAPSTPGAVDHDHRGQRGDPRRARASGGGRPGCRHRSGRRARRRAARGGSPRASRRCSAGRAARLDLRDLERRVARDGDPDHLQAIGDRRPVARLVRRLARRPRTRPGRARTPRGTARPGSGAPGGSGRTSRRTAPVASGFGPHALGGRTRTVSIMVLDRALSAIRSTSMADSSVPSARGDRSVGVGPMRR